MASESSDFVHHCTLLLLLWLNPASAIAPRPACFRRCGILCNGLAHFGRTWSTHLKGPVFAAAFSPLLVVFSLLLQICIYGSTTQIESFIGSVLVIVGLYILLWAKAKDYKAEKANTNAETLPIEASTAEPLL